jgi:hypothetical protein
VSNIYDIFVWSSDFSENHGEGLLARKFVDIFFENSRDIIKIKSNDGEFFYSKNNYKVFYKKKKTNNFYSKYLTIYNGVFFLWQNYFLKKKLCYINYLPIWNPFIFFLLPPGTILGPITGSVYKGKIINFNFFLRKYILLSLSKISLFIIFKRFKFVIFSELFEYFKLGIFWSNLLYYKITSFINIITTPLNKSFKSDSVFSSKQLAFKQES